MPQAGETIIAWQDPIVTENATNESSDPGTSFVAPTNGAGHAFVAPPSGNVMVIVSDELHCTRASATARLFASYRIGEGSTVGAGTEVRGPNLNYSIISGVGGASGDACLVGGSRVDVVTGLTPGDTYNIEYQWRSSGSPSAVGSLHRMVTTIPLP